ncbi:X-ray radiation resistance-associated protein 1-like [Babylonia areolata]|uniref:X-ray radiation resistance-associated protein 1-like n=1 Tax=Babylonia areolata TaxID=304850 RepID=UPI003FCF12FF
MALAGVKLDSDSGGFVSNCFPVRGLLKREINEGDGAWFVAHRAEQRRRFKAVLCTKPRTYSRIREERKRAEEQGVRLTAGQFQDDSDEKSDTPVLDGYFLMKHCCVEDPADLCSVNIAGLELTDVKEEDFEMFDNVAYINAGDNYLPFEAFRGFPSLRELEVPFNGLRSLKIETQDFPQLEVLDLSYNNLSLEDVLTLGQLSTLRVLHLTGNNFSTLPPDMALPYLLPGRKIHRPRFPRLEVLLLDDNRLEDITVFAALAGLPKLRHINMEKNRVFCIPQLKCVEGRVVTQDGTKSRRPKSGRRSARGSTRRQSGIPGGAPEATTERMSEDENKVETSADGAGNPPVTPCTGGQRTTEAAGDGADHKEDVNLDELLKDDFSLGELTERITELEEETAKVMDNDPDSEKIAMEDYVPKALPPFPELRYLNLAHNQIQEEDAVLAVAAWPMLVHLVIHNNPLTSQNAGDPPLLKRFLSDRLGIRLQRKDEPRLTKPHIQIEQTKSRTVKEAVPKVPRSTIEERLQQLALEAPKPPPALEAQRSKSWLLEDRTLSGLDLETSKRMPLPPIPPTPPTARPAPSTQAWLDQQEVTMQAGRVEEEERGGGKTQPQSDAFFMTQVDDPSEDKPSKQREGEKGAGRKEENVNNSSNARYRGYELLLDQDPVDMEVQLPTDIQGNVRALKHALGHTLVYRDPSVDLDRVKRTVQEFRRAPVPPAQPHKSRQQRVDDLLDQLRTRNTVDEESLTSVLKDKALLTHKFPEAQHLLGQIQRRYNSVRVSSMKEAAEARKIIDQAFEVLSKPKQTYQPSA